MSRFIQANVMKAKIKSPRPMRSREHKSFNEFPEFYAKTLATLDGKENQRIKSPSSALVKQEIANIETKLNIKPTKRKSNIEKSKLGRTLFGIK